MKNGKSENWNMKSIDNKYYKDKTRFMERNILNLGYGQFEGSGNYDIPIIKIDSIPNLENSKLIGFNYAKSCKDCVNKGVHFFLHDYQFERIWNYPQRYIDIFKKFEFILSPDFSPYADMPKATKIFNVYRNRWVGRYYQLQGIKVIPTVTLGGEDSLEYCFDGIEKNSIIAVSTMEEGRWGGYRQLFKYWDTMMNRLEPSKILLYGKDLSKHLNGNIIFMPYSS